MQKVDKRSSDGIVIIIWIGSGNQRNILSLHDAKFSEISSFF